MALTKYQNFKKLDDNELDDLILKLKKELLFLRIQKVNFSSCGLKEHNSFEIRSGNIGYTLSGRYTDVARSKSSLSTAVPG